MFTLPEQFSVATKANFDAQLAILSAFTSKAIESMEKMVDLNLTVTKKSFEESKAVAKQLISVKDPQEFFNLTTTHAQPNAEKALAYARHLASITSDAQAEFTKTAEAHVAETNRKIVAFVEEISKNAPAGSEHAVVLLKSTISNVHAGYEQITKSTKQVVETLEENLNAAANQIAQVAKDAPRAAASPKK